MLADTGKSFDDDLTPVPNVSVANPVFRDDHRGKYFLQVAEDKFASITRNNE
jgi:hypothetical protein